MIEPIGHVLLRRKLERFLPPVTLLLGGRGVGKWALGDYLLRFHNIQANDTLKITSLTVVAAHEARAFTQRKPSGTHLGLLLNIDPPRTYSAEAHSTSLNILLKALEETTYAKIIMIASELTLSTVSSRAITYQVGPMDDRAVEQAMIKYGQAAMVAGMGFFAKDAMDREAFLKPSIDSMLKALQERDRALFQQSMMAWRDREDARVGLRMMKGWLTEAIIGRWHRYSPDAAPSLAVDRAKLKALLVDLDYYVGNPKITVRASLDKHLR